VVDEFTSVVDRTVARIGSSAIQKAIRRKAGKRLVALSCHYDIVDWLEPDWVYDVGEGTFTRRSVQRPRITVEITRVHHSAWRLFQPHHYLSADLNRAATCFGAWFEDQLVAFDAWLPFVGKLKTVQKARRGHRTVCLPDFQGVGIGGALFSHNASLWSALGYRVFSRTGHPAEIRSRLKSGHWRAGHFGRTAPDTGAKAGQFSKTRSWNRIACSFEYIGPKMETEKAVRCLNSLSDN
jgi:GNAT superfamily N-acetyltransferase